ncbi:MAG: hypothetical protein ABFS34_09105 [Gemmatimonadota bacterium]
MKSSSTPRRTAHSAAFVALCCVACARGGAPDSGPVPGSPEADAVARLATGVAALELGNFSAVRTDLGWVYAHCPATEDGHTALLLLAASHLDPRNGDRRPHVAAAMAAHVLGLTNRTSTLRSAGTSLFLLSREHGAPVPDPRMLTEAAAEVARAGQGCKAETAGASLVLLEAALSAADTTATPAGAEGMAGSLPTLDVPTVPQRIAAVELQRDSLASLVTELEEQVRALRERVSIQQQELERIRRTLRP